MKLRIKQSLGLTTNYFQTHNYLINTNSLGITVVDLLMPQIIQFYGCTPELNTLISKHASTPVYLADSKTLTIFQHEKGNLFLFNEDVGVKIVKRKDLAKNKIIGTDNALFFVSDTKIQLIGINIQNKSFMLKSLYTLQGSFISVYKTNTQYIMLSRDKLSLTTINIRNTALIEKHEIAPFNLIFSDIIYYEKTHEGCCCVLKDAQCGYVLYIDDHSSEFKSFTLPARPLSIVKIQRNLYVLYSEAILCFDVDLKNVTMTQTKRVGFANYAELVARGEQLAGVALSRQMDVLEVGVKELDLIEREVVDRKIENIHGTIDINETDSQPLERKKVTRKLAENLDEETILESIESQLDDTNQDIIVEDLITLNDMKLITTFHRRYTRQLKEDNLLLLSTLIDYQKIISIVIFDDSVYHFHLYNRQGFDAEQFKINLGLKSMLALLHSGIVPRQAMIIAHARETHHEEFTTIISKFVDKLIQQHNLQLFEFLTGESLDDVFFAKLNTHNYSFFYNCERLAADYRIYFDNLEFLDNFNIEASNDDLRDVPNNYELMVSRLFSNVHSGHYKQPLFSFDGQVYEFTGFNVIKLFNTLRNVIFSLHDMAYAMFRKSVEDSIDEMDLIILFSESLFKSGKATELYDFLYFKKEALDIQRLEDRLSSFVTRQQKLSKEVELGIKRLTKAGLFTPRMSYLVKYIKSRAFLTEMGETDFETLLTDMSDNDLVIRYSDLIKGYKRLLLHQSFEVNMAVNAQVTDYTARVNASSVDKHEVYMRPIFRKFLLGICERLLSVRELKHCLAVFDSLLANKLEALVLEFSENFVLAGLIDAEFFDQLSGLYHLKPYMRAFYMRFDSKGRTLSENFACYLLERSNNMQFIEQMIGIADGFIKESDDEYRNIVGLLAFSDVNKATKIMLSVILEDYTISTEDKIYHINQILLTILMSRRENVVPIAEQILEIFNFHQKSDKIDDFWFQAINLFIDGQLYIPKPTYTFFENINDMEYVANLIASLNVHTLGKYSYLFATCIREFVLHNTEGDITGLEPLSCLSTIKLSGFWMELWESVRDNYQLRNFIQLHCIVKGHDELLRSDLKINYLLALSMLPTSVVSARAFIKLNEKDGVESLKVDVNSMRDVLVLLDETENVVRKVVERAITHFDAVN